MTYWVYAVNTTRHQFPSVVAVADIRVTWTDENNNKYHSEDANKIVSISNDDGSPFDWGSAMILVMGYPFWGSDKNKERFITGMSYLRPSKTLRASDILDLLSENFGFKKNCTLGIICFNKMTRKISVVNVEIKPSQNKKKIAINQLNIKHYNNEPNGFNFDYQESAALGNFFAQQTDFTMLESRQGREFSEVASNSLQNIIRQYSSPLSNTESFGHNTSVSSISDVAIMDSSGKITYIEGASSKEAFVPNQYNQQPTSNVNFGVPPDSIDIDSQLKGLGRPSPT